MKHIIGMMAGVCGMLALTGCMIGGGTTTIKELDANGKVVKETVQKKPFVGYVTDSTKDKTLIIWTSGWVAEVSAAFMNTEDPTPHVKIYAGKLDKGIISAKPDTQNWDGIAKAVVATKQDLNLSLTGISGTSSESKAAEKSAIDPATAPKIEVPKAGTGAEVKK